MPLKGFGKVLLGCGALFSFFVCSVVKVLAPVFSPVFASVMGLQHGKQFDCLCIVRIIMIKIYDFSPKILWRPKNVVEAFLCIAWIIMIESVI